MKIVCRLCNESKNSSEFYPCHLKRGRRECKKCTYERKERMRKAKIKDYSNYEHLKPKLKDRFQGY